MRRSGKRAFHRPRRRFWSLRNNRVAIKQVGSNALDTHPPQEYALLNVLFKLRIKPTGHHADPNGDFLPVVDGRLR